MAEELENSLQKSIEDFLNERLSAIEEQLDRLQNDFNEQIARVREHASASAVENTPLAASIAGHLQTAREQKLSGPAATAAPPFDLSALKNAITEIQHQRTQGDVLTALLRAGARFADRTVLFVVKGDQGIAWRMCRANRNEVEAVSGIAVQLSGESIVGRAARSRSIASATAANDDGGVATQLGGEAQQAVAIPLVVRNKVVAVLYADSVWPHPDAIQLEALEMLERVATMAVELVSPARVASPAPQVAAPAEPPAAAPSEVESPSTPPEVAAVETPSEQTEIPEPPSSEPEPATAETAELSSVSEPSDSIIAEPAPEQTAPPSVEPAPFTPQYSTPLGGARRYGSAETDLPVDVSDEERRLHNDARRFARLLVSEIKLYNEQKVSEGRSEGNLYDRLREDIDRSRQMYDKRVAPPVAARHDYFHQELVNLLAEGDVAKLGNSYPGAPVAA